MARNQGRPGNQNNLKHGAAAAEKALTTGADLSGLAAITEQAITSELEDQGITAIVKRDAIRLQTVADLYYAAIMGADTLEKLDALVKRYGWIQASALRAWAQVRQEEQAQANSLTAHDVLEAIQRENDEPTGGE